jgi:hypothetical protein
MPRWYVLLDGPASDLAHLKRLFTTSGFKFDQKDSRDTLSAPAFENFENKNDVINAGMELLASMNVALRLSVFGYSGLNFHGLLEERADGTKHRTMLAQGGSIGLSGAAAVAIAGSIGRPVRSREERLVSLVARNDAIADLAFSMTARPLTWGAMNTIYESAKGLMSSKGKDEVRRADYQGLIARGWITEDESKSFYKTAAYYRHGYPRIALNGMPLMDYTTASILINKLFWHLVNELEPT